MIILGTNSIKDTGYDVANSVRLDGSSAYMGKTMGTPTNTKKYTMSVWFKRSKLDAQQSIFRSTNDAASNDSHLTFNSNNTLRWQEYGGVASISSLVTNQLFRDVSAWYHVVVVYDSAQSTASNRAKMYVNGTEVTSFGTQTQPSLNADSFFNKSGETLSFGRTPYDGGGNYYSGYVAEVVMCDGQALAPTDFGEFDDSGIWKPIDVSGLTFGTNGFYLDFEDSSNLGNDANGGTDFGETNIAAIDQSTDTCTNNFATMNPLDNYYAGATFSEGNCRVVTGSSPETWNTSTFGLNSGKWYMEFTIIDEGSGGSTLIGIADRPTVSASEELGGLATTYAYLSSGNFRTNNSNTSNSVSATDGDIIGVALDLDSAQNTISYYKNDSIIVAAQNITAPVSGFYFIASGVWLDNDTGTNDHNFGNPVVAHSSAQTDANGYGSFEYAPPSGYYAICTKNLAEFG